MTSQVGLTDKQKEDLKELTPKRKRTDHEEEQFIKLKKDKKRTPELEKVYKELGLLKGRTVKQEETYKELSAIKSDQVFLSAGAKTYMEEIVNENVLGTNNRVSSNAMRKGTEVEDDSIALFNEVHGTNYEKNVGKEENDWIKGECDVEDDEVDLIVDAKSSWSLKTFPTLPRHINNKMNEWQGRGYMFLYDRGMFTLAYCMVSTPEHLIEKALEYGTEKEENHFVDHIDPRLRVTNVHFVRDLEKEEHIKLVVEACIVYADEYEEELLNKLEL